jgi:hypothetical protein
MRNKKTKYRYRIVSAFIVIGIAVFTVSCGKDFLSPKPKSFYSPKNTYTDVSGFEAALLACRKRLRWITHHERFLSRNEYVATDVSINAHTGANHDLTTAWSPDNAFGQLNVWIDATDNITDANTIIDKLAKADIQNKQKRNAILAEAYWHRAFWYLYLTMKFGDVPWVGKQVKKPKLDFYTYTRESILEKIKKDLEYAVQWLPENVKPGQINRAAGYYLLTEVYMTVGEFDNAIKAASHVIDGGKYHLMTKRFGQGRYADNPRFNVVWDLFQKKNISSSENKEVILATQDKYGLEGASAPHKLRRWTPLWWWPPVRDPDGKHATSYGHNAFSDSVGRGIGGVRPSNYYAFKLSQLPGDLRFSDTNWFSEDEYIYNVPSSNYYGQPIQKKYIGIDSIRCLFPWRYDKFFIPYDIDKLTRDGGHSDRYLYRLAGLYLLRAEAYWYNDNSAAAAKDIDAVRERSHAPDIQPSDVNIGTIFDERARELFGEGRRMTQMARASYILARQNMMGYSLDTFHKKNWWYDRVMKKNNYFRDGISYGGTTYKIAPYEVNLPIPQNVIDANTEGHINQTPGYAGSEDNIKPKSKITPTKAEKELRPNL